MPAVLVEIVAVVAPVLHKYDEPPDAVSVVATPEQIFPFVTDGVGLAITVTVPLAIAVHVAMVTVTVYVAAVPVEIEMPVAPVLHRYVPPPVTVSVAVPPAQIVGLLTVGVGSAVTVTLALLVAVQPSALVTVTL